jgi:hypothetical protein
MTTRNHIKTDDIPGATVKIYHKYYYDKENYMGEKEPEKKKPHEMRKNISNPLSPKYKYAAGKNGKIETIGAIDGQKPKRHYKRARLSDRDNMSCSLKSIEWMPTSEKYKPKLFNIQPTAGVASAACMNTMVFEEWAARGKKHFRREDSTLDGILQTPKRRIHIAAKPPVYKQPKK